jgi:hypothetical protein
VRICVPQKCNYGTIGHFWQIVKCNNYKSLECNHKSQPNIPLSIFLLGKLFIDVPVIPYGEELARRSDLDVVIGKRTMGFDADGNLLPFST